MIRALKKNLAYVLVILVSLAVLTSGTIFYLTNLSHAIFRTVQTSVEEIAVQQGTIISEYIRFYLLQMRQIAERVNKLEFSSMEAAMEWLKEEEKIAGFSKMYFVGADGALYSSSLAITRGDPLCQMFAENTVDRTGFILPFRPAENKGFTETSSFAMMFGTKAEMTAGGTALVGILAQCDIAQIQSTLVIHRFDGQAYSSLLDADGNYLVLRNPEQFSYSRQVNAIDYLFQTAEEVGADRELLLEALSNDEPYSCRYKNAEGEEMFLCVSGIPHVEWGLMIEIPYAVYSRQAVAFSHGSVAIFVILAVVLTSLMLLMIRIFRQSITNTAFSRAKNEFLSTMSHEIRTPLNGIIGLNHLMQTHVADPKAVLKYSDQLEQTSQYLLSLVSDILDVSRLQEGNMQLDVAPADLDELLDRVYNIESPAMSQNGIQFLLEKELASPCVWVDDRRLQQVLLNIVGNAAKFTHRGGRVTVKAGQQESAEGTVTTVIQVEDTGIGMTPEFLSTIFDPFTQDRQMNRASQKGTGLGMALSRRLMQAMDGNITVKSAVGKGSVFTVAFPARIAERAEALPDGPQAGAAMRLLVADDNDLNAEILLEVLRDAGIPADRAADGQQAFEMFQTSAPGTYSAILMDMQMPVMDGCEAARAIRDLDRPDARSVRIFACTANTFQEDRQRADAAGMDDFIAKPINIRNLLNQLNALGG